MEIRFDVLVTQIIGFLIVLWILKRYAWGPVLNMLEERRARIAGEVSKAEGLRKDAETLKAEYEAQIRTIEAQARQRIQEAVAEGQKVAEEIKANAHREARHIVEKTKGDLDLEYKKARATLRDDMVTMVLGATERLMHERLDAEKHRGLVDRFLSDLKEREKA